jgi:hypothetical protein
VAKLLLKTGYQKPSKPDRRFYERKMPLRAGLGDSVGWLKFLSESITTGLQVLYSQPFVKIRFTIKL